MGFLIKTFAVIGLYFTCSFLWVFIWTIYWNRQKSIGSGTVQSAITFFPLIPILAVMIFLDTFKRDFNHEN